MVSVISSVHSWGCHLAASAVRAGAAVRRDPEKFQKTAQVAGAAIQLAMLRQPALAKFSKLVVVLQSVSMHDFYAIFLRARSWFCPITADRLDVQQIVFRLGELCWNRNQSIDFIEFYSNPKLTNEKPGDQTKARNFVQICARVKQFVAAMRTTRASYASVAEWGRAVQAQVNRAAKSELIDDASLKNLNDQVIVLPSWRERCTDMTWTLVDIGCVAAFMQDWGLLDTAKWAGAMGQYAVLNWAAQHSLSEWVIGGVALGFALNALAAARQLYRIPPWALSAEERTALRWKLAAYTAECALWSMTLGRMTALLPLQAGHIYAITFIAKGLGLASSYLQPSSPPVFSADNDASLDKLARQQKWVPSKP